MCSNRCCCIIVLNGIARHQPSCFSEGVMNLRVLSSSHLQCHSCTTEDPLVNKEVSESNKCESLHEWKVASTRAQGIEMLAVVLVGKIGETATNTIEEEGLGTRRDLELVTPGSDCEARSDRNEEDEHSIA